MFYLQRSTSESTSGITLKVGWLILLFGVLFAAQHQWVNIRHSAESRMTHPTFSCSIFRTSCTDVLSLERPESRMKNSAPKSRMAHRTFQKSRMRKTVFLWNAKKGRFSLNQPFFAFHRKTVFLILLFENRFAFLSTDLKIAEPSVEHVGSCRFGLESRMSRSYFLVTHLTF